MAILSYVKDDGVLSTPCPFGRKAHQFTVHVGSLECEKCKAYKGSRGSLAIDCANVSEVSKQDRRVVQPGTVTKLEMRARAGATLSELYAAGLKLFAQFSLLGFDLKCVVIKFNNIDLNQHRETTLADLQELYEFRKRG